MPQAIQNPTTSKAWRLALREAVRSPIELLRLLGLPTELLPGADAAARHFSLLVPRGYAARMRYADPHDPLLRQVLPLELEMDDQPGFVTDPVGDMAALTAPGLIHKYSGRALIITTGACAIHCRYCFRRHYPYADASAARKHWESVSETLGHHPEIDEIILSGGDPLTLDDDKLSSMVSMLEDIPQLKRLRLHTRLPVVLPERVDENLTTWIKYTRLSTICVIHANHANELDQSVEDALKELHDAGVTLLNQSVLLRGVNDDVETLAQLSTRLFECHTLPYYLHMLDPVAGAAHFEVPQMTAATLMQQLRARLPGYLVPRLVREEAGRPSKTDIFG